MTNAQTEARAIAARIEKRVFQAEQARREMISADLNGWPNAILGLIEVVQEAATALAAKDARISELDHIANHWLAEHDKLRAQLAEANKALEAFIHRIPVAAWKLPDGTPVATAGIEIDYFRAALEAREAQGGE